MNTHHLNLLMTCVRTEETRNEKKTVTFFGGGWVESKVCWVPPICQTLWYFQTMHKTLKMNTNASHFTEEETEAGVLK